MISIFKKNKQLVERLKIIKQKLNRKGSWPSHMFLYLWFADWKIHSISSTVIRSAYFPGRFKPSQIISQMSPFFATSQIRESSRGARKWLSVTCEMTDPSINHASHVVKPPVIVLDRPIHPVKRWRSAFWENQGFVTEQTKECHHCRPCRAN